MSQGEKKGTAPKEGNDPQHNEGASVKATDSKTGVEVEKVEPGRSPDDISRENFRKDKAAIYGENARKLLGL